MLNEEEKKQEIMKEEMVNDYYPSKRALSLIESLGSLVGIRKRGRAIKKDHIAKSDGFDVDKNIEMLEEIVKKNPTHSGLQSRSLSVSDLSDRLYNQFAQNKNSIANWFPDLVTAVERTKNEKDESDFNFMLPKTKIMRLPIELAQFIRLEYQETEKEDRDFFNDYIFKGFELEEDKTYFIKTGVFSSKFQFANTKCSEPLEMGEYFQVINNFAMQVGAGHSVDLTVREYIEDVEKNPTIYNGMPLRTEFRSFVNFDTGAVYGTVPYWHPIVMKRALKMGLSDSMERDYVSYKGHEEKLMDEFNKYVGLVNKELEKLIKNFGKLKGEYSIDVMKNGEDFYVIDMALMSESALTELLPSYIYSPVKSIETQTEEEYIK